MGYLLYKHAKDIIDKNAASSIGFYMLYACMCKKSKDIVKELPAFIGSFDDGLYTNKTIDCLLSDVKQKIIYCLNEITRIMMRNFSLSGMNVFNFSLYQLVAITATLFNIKYKINKDGKIVNNISDEKYYEDFCEMLQKYIFLSRLTGEG